MYSIIGFIIVAIGIIIGLAGITLLLLSAPTLILAMAFNWSDKVFKTVLSCLAIVCVLCYTFVLYDDFITFI